MTTLDQAATVRPSAGRLCPSGYVSAGAEVRGGSAGDAAVAVRRRTVWAGGRHDGSRLPMACHRCWVC